MIETRSLNKEKMIQIRELLAKAPFNLISNFEDPNDQFYLIKKFTLDIIDLIAPIKSKRLKTNNLPWFDQDCRDSHDKRDRIHALALSFKNRDH